MRQIPSILNHPYAMYTHVYEAGAIVWIKRWDGENIFNFRYFFYVIFSLAERDEKKSENFL